MRNRPYQVLKCSSSVSTDFQLKWNKLCENTSDALDYSLPARKRSVLDSGRVTMWDTSPPLPSLARPIVPVNIHPP